MLSIVGVQRELQLMYWLLACLLVGGRNGSRTKRRGLHNDDSITPMDTPPHTSMLVDMIFGVVFAPHARARVGHMLGGI
jgi:hypothetical protein